jgi:pimeloyl-ACP methyl ester carboxylesterase
MTRRRFLTAAATGATALGASGCATGARGPEMRYPPLGGFVTVDGVRLHYLDRGEGPPVALIHGASGNLRDFAYALVDRLAARGYRVVAFDRPGFGFSDRPPGRGWNPEAQGRLLAQAARQLGAAPAIVAGHSWGGAAAMGWALADPEATAGVLSIAGATYPWGGDAGLFYRLAASDLLGGPVRALAGAFVSDDRPEAIIDRLFRPNTPPPGYARFVGVGLALRPETFRANAEDLDGLNAALGAMAPRYPTVAAPVEALHGEADRTVWAEVHAAPLARDTPRGRLTLLSGVGHMPHHVAEDAVLAAVDRLAGRA